MSAARCPATRDLTAATKRLQGSDPNLLNFLKLGHPRPDPVPTDEQWRDLIAYIRTLAN